MVEQTGMSMVKAPLPTSIYCFTFIITFLLICVNDVGADSNDTQSIAMLREKKVVPTVVSTEFGYKEQQHNMYM